MKVLEKAILKNGVQVQLEDWSDKNTVEYPTLYGLTIAAYPIAERSDGWTHGGEKFRLDISYNQYANYTNDMVLADYRALVNAEKSLEDLADHFYYGEKDKWRLGMATDYRPHIPSKW